MDESGDITALGFRLPVLVVITVLVGALVLLGSYAAGLFPQRRKNVSKNKGAATSNENGDQILESESTSGAIQNPGAIASGLNGGNTAASGKRAKNKKRREAQQEFSHPWMVGALKGHTGPVLAMNFSSNGKFLASCAEDCDLAREEEPELGDASSSSGEGDYTPEKSRRQGNSLDPEASSSKTSNEGVNGEAKDSTFLPPSTTQLKKTQPTSERASLSRRQRKNRTRGPREQQPQQQQQQQQQQRADDSEDLGSNPRHRRSQCRNENPARGDAVKLNPAKSRNSSCRITRKSPSGPKKNEKATSPSTDIVETINMEQLPVIPSSGVYKLPGISSGSYRSIGDSESFRKYQERVKQLGTSALVCKLRKHILEKDLWVMYGYPIQNDPIMNYVYVKHYSRLSIITQANVRWYHNRELNANAREFVPRNGGKYKIECETDSGNGSASSVENSDQEPECSSDSDKSSDVGESFSSSSSSSSSSSDNLRRDLSLEPFDFGESFLLNIVEHECARCMRNFSVYAQSGVHVKKESCVYHWGKLLSSRVPGVKPRMWECCYKTEKEAECTRAPQHVWTGLIPGFNGPYTDFIKTKPSTVFATDGNYGVYALDCEMCFTRLGLEVTRVTFVNMDGHVTYDSYVLPKAEIIDYNTRFSGITEEILSKVNKTLPEVRNEILNFVHAETILIGHGLANDLRVLKIVHENVIDTTVIYPHMRGFPLRRSLKALARSVLGCEIQVNQHDSIEDARTAAELMMALILSEMPK